MPGLSGIEAARCMAGRAELVFVTAFEQYAVEAFRRGAIDYLVKPIEEQRLADTVQRLRTRLQRTTPESRPELDAVLDCLAEQLRQHRGPQRRLKWIKASVGSVVRLIPVEQVVYLKSATKYTLVVWKGGEALIRKSIREMADELDPDQFLQIHRSTIVNLDQVGQFSHGAGDAGALHLKGRTERLTVSPTMYTCSARCEPGPAWQLGQQFTQRPLRSAITELVVVPAVQGHWFGGAVGAPALSG